MATLLQLRDQVIIDAGIANNPNFPTLRLNRLVNLAQRYVQAQLNGLGMKKWEAKITIGTPSSGSFGGGTNNVKTFAVTALTNMLESPNSIKFIQTTGATSNSIAYPVDDNVFLEQIENSYLAPTEKKPIFTRLAGTVLLSPSTITGGDAYYYKAITDLSADADTSEIPLEFEEFVIKKVVMDIQEILGLLQDKELKARQLEKDLSDVYQKFLGKQGEENRQKMNQKSKLQ